MFFWFIGTAVVSVWLVFRDPAIDLRMVVAGALLPDLVDAPLGGARVAHSVTFAVVLLGGFMLATVRRRALRRRLVMVSVGVLLHLVFDGAFNDTTVFWWPFTGTAWPSASLPVVARGWVNVPLEIVGIGLCAWVYRRFGLADRQRRELLVRTGRIDRSIVEGQPAPPSC
jgi:membrane-bound metal-dependent hydrolase YbcI (DUF457 family)